MTITELLFVWFLTSPVTLAFKEYEPVLGVLLPFLMLPPRPSTYFPFAVLVTLGNDVDFVPGRFLPWLAAPKELVDL